MRVPVSLLVLPACLWGCAVRENRAPDWGATHGEVRRLYERKLGQNAKSRLLDLTRDARCRITIECNSIDYLGGGPPKYIGAALAETDAGPVAIRVIDGSTAVRDIPKDAWANAKRELVRIARSYDGRVFENISASDASWWFLRTHCDGTTTAAAIRGDTEWRGREAWHAWTLVMAYTRGEWIDAAPKPDPSEPTVLPLP